MNIKILKVIRRNFCIEKVCYEKLHGLQDAMFPDMIRLIKMYSGHVKLT